jgi:membrane-associated protease RseP (regulator of RpoE activity)
MRRIPWLHIALFAATFITTLGAGALQRGADIFKEPSRLSEGLPFSVSLILILLSHEFSHYFLSKAHNTKATLPYFIPAPTFIGTFGAVIKMKSPITTRKALIDIGASGPIAGFLVSIVALIIGLSYSKVVNEADVAGGIRLGESLLFNALSYLVLGPQSDGAGIVLHPVAFAGWIGLFITSLNLLPIGQLDGGHISYAVFGEKQRLLSSALVALLAVFGILFWEGWAIWAVLLVFLGLRHPPVMYWEAPLDHKRRFISGLCLFIFIITFIPVPFGF